MNRKSIILFFLALLCVSFIANAQDFECFVMISPEKPLPNVKKIAILDFNNFDKNPYYTSYGGNAFVNYLTAKLLEENRGIYNISHGILGGTKEGKTYIKSSGISIFQIVEREQLSNVLREKSLGNDVSLDDNQAAEVGKVLGIDALIMGTVKHTYNSSRSVVKYTDGSTADCTENSCGTEIFIKIVSVANGQIIATKTYQRNSSDKKWGKDEASVLGFEPLAENNLKLLAFDASNYFSPYYAYYKADFKKMKAKEYKDKSADIKKMIDNADFTNLYSIYKAIYDTDNYNAEAAYNLALLSVITGDYSGASKWDVIANEADPKEFGKGKEWAKEWEDRAMSLASIGVNMEKFDFSSKINSDALADKIHTKGKREDRFEVYEKDDVSSSVISKVPGDTDFIVIEKDGDFIKIKLLGGKEGYINSLNLKR